MNTIDAIMTVLAVLLVMALIGAVISLVERVRELERTLDVRDETIRRISSEQSVEARARRGL